MKPHMQDSDKSFKSAEDVYWSIAKNLPARADAEILVGLRNWFINFCEFDPRTGQALPNDLCALLRNIRKFASADHSEVPKDRLSRIVDHSVESIKSIVANPRDTVHRGHAIMPIYAAREVDSASVQWLSRKPGRNLRDKLAGKPYIKAVNRRMSVDTSENRLFKAFITRLEHFLITKNEAFAEDPQGHASELIQLITRWFQNSDTKMIGTWSNLPPNNTLLQDKNYRKIWDAWLWLQALDDHIHEDHTRLTRDFLTATFWTILSSVDQLKGFRILQQPCFFSYDDYNINPALEVQGMYHPGQNKISTSPNREEGQNASKGEEKLNDHLKVKFIRQNKDEIEVTAGLKSVIINCQGKDSICLILNSEGDGQDLRFDYRWPSIQSITDESVNFLFANNSIRLNDHDDDERQAAVTCNELVLDLSAPRPKFIADFDSEKNIPFRLVRQYWESESNGRVSVDCGKAPSIMLCPEVTSISILSLFSENVSYPTGLLNKAAMEFARDISNYLNPEKLTYLVPDATNEFSLENLRRSLNFYFPDCTPLPRSIAAIFAWQSSKGFSQSNFEQGDVVLVLENSASGIVLTPVVGFVSSELSDKLPESKGVHWERHPSTTIKGDSVADVVKRVLDKDGCTLSQEIADLFGFTGLIDEKDSLSWVDPEKKWYTLPSDTVDRLRQEAGQNSIQSADIEQAIKAIPEIRKKNNVFMLPLDNSFKKPVGQDSNLWIGSAWSLVKGGQISNKWQLTAGDFPLWRDHLPDLSIRVPIDGLMGQFYLVKEAKVTPQKGKKVEIPVKELFTLPTGQAHYQFPLLQGAGGRELQFMAYLKSSTFPLQEDTVCSLKMTYTYGADDPYELNFIPKNPKKAGFRSIRVEWRDLKCSSYTELSFPAFPPPHEWPDFKALPKLDGRGSSNLYEWIQDKLQFDELFCARNCMMDIESLIKKRMHGSFEWGTLDKNGEYYCRVRSGQESIFCHSSEFIEDIDVDGLQCGDIVYFDRRETDKGAKGVNISFSIPYPDHLPHIQKKQLENTFSTICEKVTRGIFSLRFPALTVWDRARSIDDIDAPGWFKKLMSSGIKDCREILMVSVFPEDLRNEVFFFLCCLHKDAPPEISQKLMQIIDDSENDIRQLEINYRSLAYAIGNCDLKWQKKLLERVLTIIQGEDLYKSKIGLQVLSIALWRVEQLLYRFSESEVQVIVKKLLKSIENGKDNVVKVSNKKNSCYVNQYEILNLELLLALLRIRGSQDNRIKELLSPEKMMTRKLVTLIDDITKQICDQNLDIPSRVNLQIDKPKAFHRTPELLYALRMYLTGDSGANAIQVTGITDLD